MNLNDFNEWNATHFAWTTIATIPLYTIGTYIVFRKQGYNFFELFVLNTFKASQRLFAQILIFPLLLYFNGTPYMQQILNIMYIIGVILIFWTNIQFFNKMSKTKAFLFSIVSHAIFLVCFLIVTAIVLVMTGRLSL